MGLTQEPCLSNPLKTSAICMVPSTARPYNANDTPYLHPPKGEILALISDILVVDCKCIGLAVMRRGRGWAHGLGGWAHGLGDPMCIQSESAGVRAPMATRRTPAIGF